MDWGIAKFTVRKNSENLMLKIQAICLKSANEKEMKGTRLRSASKCDALDKVDTVKTSTAAKVAIL